MKYRRYRGRSLFQDKWVYGAYLKEGSRHYIISEVNKNLTAKCIVVYSKSVNEFVMNFNGEDLFEGDILDEFMRKNKLKYDEPFKVKICGCIDAIYKISFNGECFYKIKNIDNKWNNIEYNPWDLSQIMFNKNIEIMAER